MLVPLSWLKEYVDIDAAGRGAGRTPDAGRPGRGRHPPRRRLVGPGDHHRRPGGGRAAPPRRRPAGAGRRGLWRRRSRSASSPARPISTSIAASTRCRCSRSPLPAPAPCSSTPTATRTPRPKKKLKPSKIRGVESSGMVCSERELGLSEEHEGIIVLPEDAPVGMPLRDYLGDSVLELDLTPDMARCLNMIGVAREVAALTGAPLHLPADEFPADGRRQRGRLRGRAHRRAGTVQPLHRHPDPGRHHRPVAQVDAGAPDARPACAPSTTWWTSPTT